jgi:hypothetical protein
MTSISARAYEIAARELSKLAGNLSRPLADELLAVAAELKQRTDTATDIEQRREAFRQAPSRSGAAGSGWPRVQRHLNKA